MDDSDIIALYFARDERALAETEGKYGGYCFSMAYSILKNYEDAQEAVSDTWLRVWNSIPPQTPKVLKLYIAKILRNLALNTYRDHTALKRGGGEIELVLEELNRCVPAPGNVGDRLACQELSGKIQVFLKTQSARDRSIFVRRYFDVEECAAIAQHFGLTEGNVHRILSRMRKKLKNHLNREGYDI